MRLTITAKAHDEPCADLRLNTAEVNIYECFGGLGIVTSDGATYGIALRDSGLEIICPDGALVGVKRYGAGGTRTEGEVFLELDGAFVRTPPHRPGGGA